MNQDTRNLVIGGGLLAAVALGIGGWYLLSASPAADGQASAVPAAPAVVDRAPAMPGERTEQVVRAEIAPIKEQLTTFGVADGSKLMTAAGRNSLDMGVIAPLLKRMLALGEELRTIDPVRAQATADEATLMLLVLADPETTADVNATAGGATADAFFARALLAMSSYIMHETDAAAQKQAIDQFFAALKSAPDEVDDKIGHSASLFVKTPSAGPEVREHLLAVIRDTAPEPWRSTMLERVRTRPVKTPADVRG